MQAAPAPEAILEASSVTKRFGGLVAVDGVSMSIRRGEIVGIIGPNGAGKSTLLSVISGTEKPTSGHIRFRGHDITGLPSHAIGKLGLGRTFQIVKPFANMTVRENVAVGALFGRHGLRRSARAAFAAADAVIERVGLADYAKRFAAELPLAGRKRLEVAKVLATDPEVVLLDEVMAGLSSTEINEAMGLLRSVNADGVTVVVVEHVMKAIMGISRHVIVLHQGAIIAQGTPAEVVSNPLVIEAYLGKRYAGASARAPGC